MGIRNTGNFLSPCLCVICLGVKGQDNGALQPLLKAAVITGAFFCGLKGEKCCAGGTDEVRLDLQRAAVQNERVD